MVPDSGVLSCLAVLFYHCLITSPSVCVHYVLFLMYHVNVFILSLFFDQQYQSRSYKGA